MPQGEFKFMSICDGRKRPVTSVLHKTGGRASSASQLLTPVKTWNSQPQILVRQCGSRDSFKNTIYRGAVETLDGVLITNIQPSPSNILKHNPHSNHALLHHPPPAKCTIAAYIRPLLSTSLGLTLTPRQATAPIPAAATPAPSAISLLPDPEPGPPLVQAERGVSGYHCGEVLSMRFTTRGALKQERLARMGTGPAELRQWRVLAGPGCHDVIPGRHWYSSFVTEWAGHSLCFARSIAESATADVCVGRWSCCWSEQSKEVRCSKYPAY